MMKSKLLHSIFVAVAAIILGISPALSSVNIMAENASDQAKVYNSESAVAWALNESEHLASKNAGVVCAPYVSKCLQHGGIPIPTEPYPNRILSWIQDNGYGTYSDVTEDSLSCMEAGDVIVWCCDNHSGLYGLHTVFVTSVDHGSRTLRYCANNNYHHNAALSFANITDFGVRCNACGSNRYVHSYILHMNRKNAAFGSAAENLETGKQIYDSEKGKAVNQAFSESAGSFNGTYPLTYEKNGRVVAKQSCAYANYLWKNVYGIDLYDRTYEKANTDGPESEIYSFLVKNGAKPGDWLWFHNSSLSLNAILGEYSDTYIELYDGIQDGNEGKIRHSGEQLSYSDASMNQYFGGFCEIRLYKAPMDVWTQAAKLNSDTDFDSTSSNETDLTDSAHDDSLTDEMKGDSSQSKTFLVRNQSEKKVKLTFQQQKGAIPKFVNRKVSKYAPFVITIQNLDSGKVTMEKFSSSEKVIYLQNSNYQITVDCDTSVNWLTYGGGITDMSDGGYDIYSIWSKNATWSAAVPAGVRCEKEG